MSCCRYSVLTLLLSFPTDGCLRSAAIAVLPEAEAEAVVACATCALDCNGMRTAASANGGAVRLETWPSVGGFCSGWGSCSACGARDVGGGGVSASTVGETAEASPLGKAASVSIWSGAAASSSSGSSRGASRGVLSARGVSARVGSARGGSSRRASPFWSTTKLAGLRWVLYRYWQVSRSPLL